MRPIARRLCLLSLLLLSSTSFADANAPRTTPADARIDEYRLSPELTARAEAYAHTRNLEYVVGLVFDLAVLALLLRLGVARRYQSLAEGVSRRRFVQAIVFAPLFLFTLAVLELPTGIWSHVVERRYGLSIQGWGSFARDWAIGQVLALLLGTFLVWLLYAVMRKSQRRWWFWTWLALLPVMLIVMFIQPVVVEPLFFKFDPLAAKHPALVERLHAIAEKGGEDIPRERMFEMNASSKLNSVNAYVTGFGASKRVVVWDTTLNAMNDREVAFVFGHELGHYVLGHVVIGLVLGALGLLFFLFVGARLLTMLVARRGAAWSIARFDELASLPLILLILSVLSTLATPIGAAVSRTMEHQADAFGLKVIQGAVDDPSQAAAHAFVRLGEIDLAEPNPSPLAVFWRYDHPPIRDRVAFVLGKPY